MLTVALVWGSCGIYLLALKTMLQAKGLQALNLRSETHNHVFSCCLHKLRNRTGEWAGVCGRDAWGISILSVRKRGETAQLCSDSLPITLVYKLHSSSIYPSAIRSSSSRPNTHPQTIKTHIFGSFKSCSSLLIWQVKTWIRAMS